MYCLEKLLMMGGIQNESWCKRVTPQFHVTPPTLARPETGLPDMRNGQMTTCLSKTWENVCCPHRRTAQDVRESSSGVPSKIFEKCCNKKDVGGVNAKVFDMIVFTVKIRDEENR